MTILLHHSGDLPPETSWDSWAGIAGADPDLPAGRRMPGIAGLLEDAFDDIAGAWLDAAREMSSDPSSGLTHVSACATNVSDFGEMLAWSRLCAKLNDRAAGNILIVCDDPWLFRHIASQNPGAAGRPPAFGLAPLRRLLRGFAARTAYALRAAADCLLLRHHRNNPAPGGAWLLVYGHPRSDASGEDGYFGDLPRQMDHVSRALHVDCSRTRAAELFGSGRTISLRAWGSLTAAATLPFTRWRPGNHLAKGPYGWLVRRAAALDGGTAQAASIRWQVVCQNAWLRAAAPRIVAWPWENHAWERTFIRDARQSGVQTLGYQHSVIGRQMLNYSPRSLPDGSAGFPDLVLCTGPSTRDQLLAWDVPPEKVGIGGALRFTRPATPHCETGAPVFVALPFDHVIAAEMIGAIRDAQMSDTVFVVRDHPMTPFPIDANGRLRRADGPLEDQSAVSAVLYAATTVGLEALVGGLPALRFRSRTKLSVDILPPGLHAAATEAETLAVDLGAIRAPEPIDRANVFAPPDMTIWNRQLEAV